MLTPNVFNFFRGRHWQIASIDKAAESRQVFCRHRLRSEKPSGRFYHHLFLVFPRKCQTIAKRFLFWTSKTQCGITKGSLQQEHGCVCLSVCLAAIFWVFSLSFGGLCLQPYLMDLSSLLSCGWTRSTSHLAPYQRCERGRKACQNAVFLHCCARKTIFLQLREKMEERDSSSVSKYRVL